MPDEKKDLPAAAEEQSAQQPDEAREDQEQAQVQDAARTADEGGEQTQASAEDAAAASQALVQSAGQTSSTEPEQPLEAAEQAEPEAVTAGPAEAEATARADAQPEVQAEAAKTSTESAKSAESTDSADTNSRRTVRARVRTPIALRHKIPAGSGAAQKQDKHGKDSSEPVLENLPDVLPVVPMRDVVLFNFMILPLFITRDRSVAAIETTLEGPHYVLALTQKKEEDDKPTPDDLYTTGTVVQVLRILKMPDNRIKTLVQGVARAKVRRIDTEGPYMKAAVDYLDEPAVVHDATVEAMLRMARDLSEKVMTMRGIASPDLIRLLQGIEEPGRLADLIAANLRMKVSEAQTLLEINDPVDRLRKVSEMLTREVEVATVQLRIQSSAKEGIDKAQKDFFLREQLKAIRQELGDVEDGADDLDKLREALKNAGLPEDVNTEAQKLLHRLSIMHADSSEANILRTYLETLSELPWNKTSEDNLDILNAQQILNEDHYGLDKIKDRILEFLSVRKLNPDTQGSILCFVGPPGVGKTSLGKSVAKALGRKFERLSLGGLRDEAEIRGHRRTYIGAMPGRIIQALHHAGTRNPVIVLDEIDKVGTDFRGDPQSALLEVLDPEQNNTFRDHYLNVPFDLSRVMFLCTANQLETIPAALRDRMEIIRLPGYTMQEKQAIARRYLVKKRVADNGLAMEDVEITDEAIEGIILNYTREAGVRELERQIGTVCRKFARRKAEGQEPPFRAGREDLQDLLGPAIFLDEERADELLPGMAYGLAWTRAGGEVLTIETAAVSGKGKVLLTGSLGDVMKESAQAAISYLRSNAATFGLDASFDEKTDIHVHVPDGATPKDGPSAGVTLTTALLSALKDAAVRSDLCMTGEIDIKGRVLPVGGIKEKLLGAMARGLKKAVIPWQNQKDLVDIPQDLRDQLEIIPVRNYSQIYDIAFSDEAKKAKPRKTRAGSSRSRKAKAAPADNADTTQSTETEAKA